MVDVCVAGLAVPVIVLRHNVGSSPRPARDRLRARTKHPGRLPGIAYRDSDHLPTPVTAIVTAVVSAWTIVARLVFSQPTVQNLAIAGLALAGLTTNELTSERVIHSLEMSEDRGESQLAAAA
jgi:hypothetical protein